METIVELGMHWAASAGGADRYFHGLLTGLEALGAPCVAAAFGEGGTPLNEWQPGAEGRVSLGSARDGLLRRLAAARRFGRAVAAARPRVVATHFALYAAPLFPLPKVTAHVVHFHGPWAGEAAAEGAPGWSVLAKACLERRVYGTARRCIVLSRAFGALLEERYRVDPAKITVIPGGVDTARFTPARSRREARRQLGWPEEGRILFCVRRMVRRMGLEGLLEAFATVANRHPEALLVLGGHGPLTGELQARAAALGLGGRVLFPGFLEEAALPLAYAAADFTVVPSRALEGFGLVTLESLACGTPALVTPVGGLPEAVAGLDASLVLPGCEPEALAEGLRRGLEGALPSPEACRRHAEAFSWPRIARRVLESYREAAA